jgi:hypothetical protein
VLGVAGRKDAALLEEHRAWLGDCRVWDVAQSDELSDKA